MQMPAPQVSVKRTKLEMLFGVFETFHTALAEVPDPMARKLCENWSAVRGNYLNPPQGIRPSQLASGLEQGLLETPMFAAAMAQPHRAQAEQALLQALKAEYPSFLSSQKARLSKIISRGRINSESEFMLVRHAVDVAEGNQDEAGELQNLYILLDQFEARGARGV
jgi:hypothetical protein